MKVETKSKGRGAPLKRGSKKKPKDKPKRPLSAYNYFFKEERERILKYAPADDREAQKEEEGDDFISDEMLSSLRNEDNKVSFVVLGRMIGSRWKTVEPERRSKLSQLASEDTERYKHEMAEYKQRQQTKMREDAAKPIPLNASGVGGGFAEASGGDSLRGGYEDAGRTSAFVNPTTSAGMGGFHPVYGGMDRAGGSLGYGMYGPQYGHYGMMPPHDAGSGPGMHPGQYANHPGASRGMYMTGGNMAGYLDYGASYGDAPSEGFPTQAYAASRGYAD